MIKLLDGDRLTLYTTESVVLALWQALEPTQRECVARGLLGEEITTNPMQLNLTLDGVLLEIAGVLSPRQNRRFLDALEALRGRQPIPQLTLQRIVPGGQFDDIPPPH